jgi:hypothetical protein
MTKRIEILNAIIEAAKVRFFAGLKVQLALVAGFEPDSHPYHFL